MPGHYSDILDLVPANSRATLQDLTTNTVDTGDLSSLGLFGPSRSGDYVSFPGNGLGSIGSGNPLGQAWAGLRDLGIGFNKGTADTLLGLGNLYNSYQANQLKKDQLGLLDQDLANRQRNFNEQFDFTVQGKNAEIADRNRWRTAQGSPVSALQDLYVRS